MKVKQQKQFYSNIKNFNFFK